MGTTADKLTYLNNTKLAIKNELNKFGADIEDNDTFRSYANALESIYNDYPTINNNGGNIVLNNTKKAPFKKLELNSTELTQILVPNGYTQVDYIEFSGTQYIDTNTKPTSNIGVYIDTITASSFATADNIVVGSRDETGNRYFIYLPTRSNIFGIAWKDNYVFNDITLTTNTEYKIYMNYKNNKKIYLNSEELTYTFNEYSGNDFNLYIGCAHNNGNPTAAFSGKIKRCQITNNTSLIRDFIPCYRNSDNVIGMYDIINDTFYTNKGTGVLTYGSVVSNPTPSPDNQVDVNVIKGENNVKVENKNLFKPYTNSGSVTSNGVVYTMNNDNTITINGTATGSTWVEILANFINTTSTSTTKYLNLDNTKDYTLKVTVLSGTYTGTVRFYAQTNSSGGEVNSYIGNSSLITNSDGLYRAWLRVDSGASFENCKIGIQLEEGSTATEYIEHREQNYPISLSSKNLLNVPSTFTFKATYSIDMELEAGNYTLSWSSVFTDSTNIRANVIMNYEDGTTSGNNFVNFSSTNRSLSPSKKVKRIYFYSDVGAASSANITITYKNLMLEQGSIATEYEPYHEPIEYCKIGDYADQVFKNTIDSEFYDSTLVENEWYLKKNIDMVVLDGSENWNYVSGTHPRFTMPKSDIALQEFNAGAPNVAISDYFKASNWYSVYSFDSVDNAICSHNSSNVINIKSTQFTNLDDFKTWLSTHNTKVYYLLTAPQYIHISESNYLTLKAQLDNLYNNAKSCDGQTNITQTNDGLPFNINASALMKGDI